MPRYYFHHCDGVEHLDADGVELAGPNQAKDMALSAAGEAIRDLCAEFWWHPEWRTWVTDEGGGVLCSCTFLVDLPASANTPVGSRAGTGPAR